MEQRTKMQTRSQLLRDFYGLDNNRRTKQVLICFSWLLELKQKGGGKQPQTPLKHLKFNKLLQNVIFWNPEPLLQSHQGPFYRKIFRVFNSEEWLPFYRKFYYVWGINMMWHIQVVWGSIHIFSHQLLGSIFRKRGQWPPLLSFFSLTFIHWSNLYIHLSFG